MYTNDSKFSFRDIILQFLFVALFVFILIWLFPTKNYVNEAKSELLENNTDSQDQTSTLISKINKRFINLIIFHISSINYIIAQSPNY